MPTRNGLRAADNCYLRATLKGKAASSFVILPARRNGPSRRFPRRISGRPTGLSDGTKVLFSENNHACVVAG
jgi:hypothetical protein